MGIIYAVMAAVSVGCGFISRKESTSKLTLLVGIIMVAACAYACIKYSWWHIMGLVGVTLVGYNIFAAIDVINRSKKAEKERIDKIFDTSEEDE